MQFDRSNTVISFKMKVANVPRIFQFDTKQGEEICVALQTHIDDDMLRCYSKARSSASSSISGDLPPNVEVHRIRVQDLPKAPKKSQRNVNEVALLEQKSMEARLAQLGDLMIEMNTKKDLIGADTQLLQKLQGELKLRSEELHAAEDTMNKLVNEKISLEEMISGLEKKKADEDIDTKNEQTAAILKRQEAQLAELEVLYKEEQVLRKRYFNTIEDMKGKIRVFCRLRPLNEKETAEKERDVLTSPDEFTVEHPWKDDKAKQHIYDHVFDGSATQEDVFENTRHLVQSAVDGYNVCIFAYGQTGSGKTFTIYGSENNPGLTPRATAELFKITRRDGNKFSFSLKAYMVELYQDTLIDLLLPTNAQRLKLDIKKDLEGMIHVENVTVVSISTFEELLSIIQSGFEQRHTSGTQMNEESSRSHLILSIVIESTNLQTRSVVRGKLSFVDLAGSERVKKSGSLGSQLKEAQSINKSLSALGDVISALTSGGQHIPYRNHKLTMLMSDSLGGNAKTLMFVNVSPAESNLDETHNSLMYASRVRSIVNDPRTNISSKEVVQLKRLVAYWKEQAGRKGDDEEFEEIQEERPARDRKDDLQTPRTSSKRYRIGTPSNRYRTGRTGGPHFL
ncbi:kinesin-like protein KIN-14E isoform X2 [Corylus avellana]|uniref:kinesin-like protein KIN-14E isoform X2 n=1 Tax=Corylus avellana TaxID=13451 RepID=UPI00286CE01D|nr:kinesin-like protein KIN-14E isoform X2 [Corylus avellana]